ncbi:MAG TPA: hypothetical protein VMU48_17060 [Terracidiphilus sp.]|nr:hypothetical protein [Terracidiphilus sp.]
MFDQTKCTQLRGSASILVSRGKWGLWLSVALCSSFVLLAVLGATAQNGQAPEGALRNDKIALPTPVNEVSGPSSQMAMRGSDAKGSSYEAANAERHKEIVNESTELLGLALALKTDVDKTNKDMLSVTVIRKAEQIEKLARTVKEKMKLSTRKG